MTDTSAVEQEFIELAANNIRRVQTPEGAQFYDLPVGSIITADIIKAKKAQAAAQGKKAPKNALTPKAKPVVAQKANSGKNDLGAFGKPNGVPADIKAQTPAGGAEGDYKVAQSSLKGPNAFVVGKSTFSAPAGSKLVRPKNQHNMAYVVTPDNTVHAFNESGEIEVPEYLKDVLAKKFKDMKGEDALYKVDNFDAAQTTKLADQQPGANLKKNGKVAFTKQADGTWLNPTLGVQMTDDDLQTVFDNGSFELEPANIVEEQDFSKLTEDELAAALESFPDGKQLKFGNAVMTKTGDNWISSVSGQGAYTNMLAALAVGTTQLTDKLDNPEPEPEKPLSQKDKDAKDPLLDAEAEVSPVNEQRRKAKATLADGAYVREAGEDEMLYHEKLGPITKLEDDYWTTEDGKFYHQDTVVAAANAGALSTNPWVPEANVVEAGPDDLVIDGWKNPVIPDAAFDFVEQGQSIKAVKEIRNANPMMGLFTAKEVMIAIKDGKIKKPGSEDGAPEAPKQKFAIAESDISQEAWDLLEEGKWISAIKQLRVDHPLSLAEAKAIVDAMKTGEIKKPDVKEVTENFPDAKEQEYEFEKGEKLTPEALDHLPEGSIVVNPGGKTPSWTKNENGNWVTPNGGVFTPDQLKDGLQFMEKPEISYVAKDEEEAEVQPEGELFEDLEEDAAMADIPEKGQILTSLEGFEPGDAIWLDGAEASYEFIKQEDGTWQDSYENVWTDASLQIDLDDGAVWLPKPKFESLDDPWAPLPEGSKPETAKKNSDKTTAEIVTSVAELDDAASGEVFEVGSFEYTKRGSGQWESSGGYFFNSGDFEPDILQSMAKWKPSPEAKPEDEPLAPWELELLKGGDGIETGAKPFLPVDATVPEFDKLSGSMSKSEVYEAIDALESHSGFQVKYGLKSLSEDHPLKKNNSEYLSQIQDDAKVDFPDLSPKKALIALLKNGVGEKDDQSAATPDAGDKDTVQIGAAFSKTTQTGLTGGVFTKADIKNAISILENFQGKVFKAELNKHANPLGQLSPNDIVGFNKDKTVTKNKFIDLLKSKLGPEKSLDEQLQGGDISLKKYKELKGEPDSPFKDIDDYPLDSNEANALPLGSVVEEFEEPYSPLWTKTTEGWENNDYDPIDKFSGSNFKVISQPEEPKPSVSDKEDLTVQSMDEIANLPVGSKVRWYNPNFTEFATYTKTAGNTWINDEDEDSYGDSLFKYAIPKGYIKTAPDADEPEAKHALIGDEGIKKIGGQAGSNAGGLYELPTPDGLKKFYVKKAQTKDHGANEALANQLYVELGVNAPNVDFAEDGNIYSEIIDGKHDMQQRLKDDDWMDVIRRDYVIDAWLSNRDVFGLTYDNILSDKDGKPWKIDNGGALTYRAMGEKKTDFGDEVTELDAFRKGKKAVVFGEDVMTLEQEMDGVNRLAKLSPERIQEMVNAVGLDNELANKLIARRQHILDKYGFQEEVDTSEIEKVPVGGVVPNVAYLYSMPVGSRLKSSLGMLYTKEEDGQWKPDNGTTLYPSEKFGPRIAVQKIFVEKDPSQEPEPLFEVPTYTKPEDIENAPIGAMIEHTPSGHIYTKTSANEWTDQNGKVALQYGIKLGTQSGYIKAAGSSTEVPDTADEPETKYSPGQKLFMSDIENLPIGAVVTESSSYKKGGYKWTKVSDTEWQGGGTGATVIQANDFEDFATVGKITYGYGDTSAVVEPEMVDPDAFDLDNPEAGKKITTADQVKGLPVGSIVETSTYSSSGQYTKISDTQFKNNDTELTLPTHLISKTAENSAVGSVTYVGFNDWGTDSPEEVKLDPKELPSLTWDEWKDAPVGTELISASGEYKYIKKNMTGDVIATGGTVDAETITVDSYFLKNTPNWLKVLPKKDYPNGITPAKYNSGKGAKTSLYVKPDGTGVFKGMKGVVKALDVEGVKKNFDAGMSQLVSPLFENDYPEVSDGTPTVKKSAPKNVIKTLGTVDDLPDGNYVDAAGANYAVSGDSVKISKAYKTLPFSELAVGKHPDSAFLEGAPNGTKLAFRYSPGDDPAYMIKNDEGSWVPENENITYINSYFNGIGNPYSYYHSKWKIASFPGTDDTDAKKSSLKTKFLQGQLIDPETKTSVIPPGYSGKVTFYGGATDIESINNFKNFLANPSNTFGDKATAHTTFGVPMNPALFKKVVVEKYNNNEEVNEKEKLLELYIKGAEDFLAEANIPEPPDLSSVFEYDEDGNVPKSVEVLAAPKPAYYNPTGAWSSYIKTISASIGDGTIVGQNMLGATKDDKKYWVQYYEKGNFKGMYDTEVQVAKSKNKPHPSGAAHPGHPNNPLTHTIKWGPAVKGEVPAGTEVPGNWTSIGIDASMPEIDNYLILAKMQNPTHLSAYEKRQWVTGHRQSNKDTVDKLSATAQDRANKGLDPLSEAPVWADNVQPAKSYESMFDNGPWPQNWSEYPNYYHKAPDFYNDTAPNEPSLVAIFNGLQIEDPYGAPDVQKGQALNSWFAAKEEAYLEELNKPEWEIFKTISEGSHPTFIIKDKKSDKMKIFKPLTPHKEWRSENEVAAHNLGAMLGFNVPKASISEVNEGLPPGVNNKGIVMDFAPNVGSIGNVDGAPVDLKTLTPKQFGQLASEHVFDWFLDNDDTHEENLLIGTDGDIVGIDKGRAFVQYGHWHGLDVDNPSSLNVNTKDSPNRKSVVYAQMIKAIKNGQISQEQLDAAYKAAIKAAKRVQKSDDATISAFVKSATESRDDWSLPSYAANWDFMYAHPNNQDELVGNVLTRKSTMLEDFEEFYEKLYAASGYAKPIPPAKALGEEHLSGWEEADVITKAEDSKVWGAAPIHASAGFIEGASLIWTEQDTNGNAVISGKFQLGNITQEKVLQFMSSKVSPNSAVGSNATLVEYPTAHVKTWKKTVTAVGKDISANATTGDYDQSLISTMKGTQDKVNVDLGYAETVDYNSKEQVKFPSGISMPAETVPQYVMALNYHNKLIDEVEKAISEKIATDKAHFQDFDPPTWKNKGNKYTSPEGHVYKELDDGNYVEVKNGVASIVPDIPDGAKSMAPGWTTNVEEPSPDQSPEKITLISAGMFGGTLKDDGEKVLKSDFNTSGHPGKEYRIDLPTGEKIFFRNGSQTGTVLSQTGTVRFQLNRLIDSESSLANVQSYLEKTGINFQGADEEQVESVYWRQMFGRIIGSNTSSAPASVQKARTKLIGMKSELAKKLGKSSIADADIPEAVGLTTEDERSFWNSLAEEAFGAEKVQAFLAAGQHLPKYQHMDVANPEKSTGLPWFKRIDVDVDALLKKGTMIAHGNSGKDARHFDYIKSGAYTSTEERLRILGYYKTGASSSSDQGYGAAKYVFTRIAAGSAAKQGAIYGNHVMYWSPEVMAMTGTYSYTSDNFGKLAKLESDNKYNPMDSLSKNTAGGNETMVPNNISLLDFMEIMVFDKENERQKAIAEFKKKGIETLRGVAIEDRLVLRSKLDSALANIKKGWKT